MVSLLGKPAFARHAHMLPHALSPCVLGLHSNGSMLCSREGSNCRHTGKGTLPPSGKAPLSCCRYVTVDEDAGRALYYVFQESLGKPDSDPLVLWLNGVRMCSLAHSRCK